MSSETTTEKSRFTYHQQRINWPLLAGFIAFLLAQNGMLPGSNRAIPAFIAYVVTGLFYDWLIFNFLGYKDSERLTKEQLKFNNVTGEQFDKINEFFVMVRHCAVAASVFATVICALFFPEASFMGTFFFTYIGVTILLISIGMFTKEIAFKYTAHNVLVTVKKEESFFQPIAIDPTSNDPALNPNWMRF